MSDSNDNGVAFFFQSVSNTTHATGPEKSAETHDRTTKSKADNVTTSPNQLKQYASRTVYTVQAGSFIHLEDAQKQFDSIVQGIPEKYLDYLRIEKIGKYYTVRNGIFEDRVSADTFLQAMKSRFPAALIRKAYIKSDRIKKIYRDSSSDDKHKIEEKVLADSRPQKTGLRKKEKSVHQKESEIYTIETGRYINYDDAQKNYDSIVQGSNTKELAYNLSYLRIEKTGKKYSVRIGKFKDRVIAEKFLRAIKSRFTTVVILKDYIKDDRIIKLYQQ